MTSKHFAVIPSALIGGVLGSQIIKINMLLDQRTITLNIYKLRIKIIA